MKIRTRSVLLASLMLAASLAHADYQPFNRVQAMEKTPTINGSIAPGEWPEEHIVRLSRQFRPEHLIELYFAWDATYLYLGAYIEDGQLWADGDGGGAGDRWETAIDDSIEWYFDFDNSGESSMTENDRLFAINLGNPTDSVNGSGTVGRYNWAKGNGTGGLPGAGALPDGLTWASDKYGTVNNNADTDMGYSMEVRIPWSALPGGAPADGQYMGVNVIVIFDDTGGTRDWDYNRHITPEVDRFSTPIRLDEYLELRCSTQSGSQSGVLGPSDYQTIQFHSSSDSTAPAAVGSLSVARSRPRAAQLSWTSPGDNGSTGVCAGYDVRYSTSAMTAGNFDSATKAISRLYPHASGTTQKFNVMGLTPETAYWFGVRAYDEAGNHGTVSVVGPSTMPSLAAAGVAIGASHYKGAVQVSPSGRYFMTEDGANFIPVGAHFLYADQCIRYLYDDYVWTGSGTLNYAQLPGADSYVTGYLDKLASNNVSVMRIWMEDLSWATQDNGSFNAENGAYWVEWPKGTYNDTMGGTLTNLLRLCSERNIYVAIVAFDSYFYQTHFTRTCVYSGNGGPLSSLDNFWTSAANLQMCKDRWSWIINTVNASGYADAVFAYEAFNEWDSVFDSADTGGSLRTAFVKALAQHIRTIDSVRVIASTCSYFDPRGVRATLSMYDDAFDAHFSHIYTCGSEIPASNPNTYIGPAVFEQNSRFVSWWSLNQLNRMPFLNGEWMPQINESYSSSFTEDDDELLCRRVWFTELCSGAAGAGIRLQGSVRAGETYKLFLSDDMYGVMKTLSAFVENGSTDPALDFTDFPSQNLQGYHSVLNTGATVLSTGCSDGRKGLVYLLQDRNKSSGTISGATLKIIGMQSTDVAVRGEFWNTTANQSTAAYTADATVTDNAVTFTIPSFSEDWAFRFYPMPKPGRPGIRPASGVTNIPPRPQFGWDSARDADWYQVYINRNGSAYKSKWVQTTNWTADADFVSGSYEWWIQAYNDGGAMWSTGGAFNIPDYKPGAGVPIAPTGKLTTTRKPAFSWQAVADTTWYSLDLDRNGADYRTKWVAGTETNWTWPEVLAWGDYTWRVDPWNSDGYGPGTNTATFSIARVVPTNLVVITPTGGVHAAGTIAYQWQADTNALYYRIWIGRNDEAQAWYARWYHTNSLVTTGGVVTLTLSNHVWGAYDLYLTGWATDGFGPWTGPIEYDIGKAVLLTPSGTLTNAPTVLTWNDASSAGASWYQFWINKGTVKHWGRWVNHTNTVATNRSSRVFVLPGDVPAFTTGTYKWWVHTYHSDGSEVWSDPATFDVP